MNTPPTLLATFLFVLAAGTTLSAADYDFFEGARYPGPIKKPGVDLYKVKLAGADDPKAYERREVIWWPRKGVDIIDVKAGMPLRTWTRRDGEPPRGFKAHLIGFRGIGNKNGNPYGGPKYYCPAVVLRLEDGRKRCFTRDSLVEEDEKYILDLYLKEMDRIRATLTNEKYELRPGTDTQWPDNAKPGEPGTMRVESAHFVWVSGSQQAPSEQHSPWVNHAEPEKARLFREGAVTFAEDMWAYQEYAGVLMPYWDRPERHKYEITVVGTYRDGSKWLPGYAGGGYGGCGIKHSGGGPWSGLLMHEWGHGMINQGGLHGEILSDSCAVIDDPAGMRHRNNVARPWRCCIHGAYETCLLFAITGQDPNWGYAMAVTLPARNDESIFQRLARLGEQRALFPNGIRGAGDVVGDFSARLAEFDCELQADLRRAYTSVKRNYLEAVDRKGGWYRIPWAESPEPFGSNIIRLVPEAGAGKIVVDFRGFHDPDTFGDWRACIVAVDKADKCRYSPLWNKGVMEMEVRPDDTRFWLTVAATPTALPANWSLYVGRHAYRYPYEVKLSGCRPGTPLNLPAVAGKRHPNGGGMVVSSAEVAPTAYVGPDAVVFDGAKVLDHAVIEDFAVVRGGVTVAGHAKVGGQAEVSGNVVIDGYTRVLHPVSVKDQKDAPHEVPLRPEQQKDDLRKLWANYAMDREETELLEDWFRYKSFPQGVFFVLNLNGHLYGRPAFVVDGDHRGFRFDGKTQYAEAAPHLADLGEITVDIGLKWEGGANQAVFDFGTSADNRLVLIPAGASGKLELAIAREGKIERIIADTALPKDKWAQCRVEIDGKKIALWIDGRKAAEKASGFRPADVYLPGAEKRNFIAAARDGAGHFKGCLDHLRVHYKVYGDFSKEPVPRRHAPQRISKEFIEDYRKEIGGAKELEALVNAKREPLVAYYQQTRGVMDQRIREIDDGSEAVAEARRKLQELEKKLEQQNKEQSAKSDKPSETIKQQTAALSRQIIEAKMAVDAAIQENGARHSPERSWLGNYSRAAFSGHYNYPYHRYIQKWASLQVGGGEEPQEDLNSLEEVYTAQDAAKWYTKCDWEWRMPWEQDHSIDKLPLVKKWLERARGK
jgi:hypothetical protein